MIKCYVLSDVIRNKPSHEINNVYNRCVQAIEKYRKSHKNADAMIKK